MSRGFSIVACVTLFLVNVALPSPNRPVSPSRRSALNRASSPAPCGILCGTERWPVKTLTDSDSATVNATPEDKTVDWLVAQPTPTGAFPLDRRFPIEKRTFSVKGRLVGYKVEQSATGDQDFHVVIKSLTSGSTMIVEIPSKECQAVCSSPHADEFEAARAEIVRLLGAYPSGATGLRRATKAITVNVTGVAMFDPPHGQTGRARNGIELHPVLSVQESQ
jgi:hypothetical protein